MSTMNPFNVPHNPQHPPKMKSLNLILSFFLLTTPTCTQSSGITAHSSNDVVTPGCAVATTHTRTWPHYLLLAANSPRHPFNLDSPSTPDPLYHCETSRDSPTRHDVFMAVCRLKELGDTRCSQTAPAFAICTVLATHESGAIMICGSKGVGMKCSKVAEAVEDLMELCTELVSGVERVGGRTFTNPKEPRDKTRVVVFNYWDGSE